MEDWHTIYDKEPIPAHVADGWLFSAAAKFVGDHIRYKFALTGPDGQREAYSTDEPHGLPNLSDPKMITMGRMIARERLMIKAVRPLFVAKGWVNG